MNQKRIEKMAKEHSNWFVNVYSNIIKIVAYEMFIHGYKHGYKDKEKEKI